MTPSFLVVAPHHAFDDYNGANYYCDWVVDCLRISNHVFFVNRDGLWEIKEGGKRNLLRQANLKVRGRVFSSVNTILFGGQYFEERLVPVGFADFFSTIDLSKYTHFIISFLHVYFSLKKSGFSFPGQVRVLTHNFDLDIFDRWVKGGGGRKFVARKSLGRYIKSFESISDNIRLVSISESDSERYSSLVSDRFNSVVCPVSSPSPYAVKCYCSKEINLVFLGSLSTPFNIEALAYFRSKISVALSGSVKFNFHVCGSNPTQEVMNMASEENWVVHENLPDDELDLLLSTMTAGILPFEYSQGVKLKIWKFFSLGLPVIGTEIFADLREVGSFFYASDDFESWGDWLNSLSLRDSIDAHCYWAKEISVIRQQVVKSLG